MTSTTRRGRARRWALAACAATSATMGDCALAADPVVGPEPASGRVFTFEPEVGIEETFTDNVALSSRDRRSDAITSGLLAATARLETPRITAELIGEARYDAYAREHDRNGAFLSGSAQASYELLRDAAWLKAQGAVTNGAFSTFAVSASDRHGAPGRIQVTTYDAGPEVQLGRGQLNVTGAARVGQVLYSNPGGGPDAQLPPDDSFVQVAGAAVLGGPSRRLELRTSAEYLADDLDFTATTAIQSAYVRIARGVRLIGRAGYERLTQRNLLRINAPVLSAGVELRPNNRSLIRLEGGERYHRPNWSADASMQVSDRLYLAGGYSEIVQPDQLGLARAFRTFTEAPDRLPPPLLPTGVALPGSVYNETSLYKSADLRALYRSADTSVTLGAAWTDRRFLTAGGRDRTLITDAAFSRQVRPDLSVGLQARYAKTYESPRFGPSRSFGVSADAAYRLNSRTRITASIAHTDNRELVAGGERVRETAALIGLRRAF